MTAAIKETLLSRAPQVFLMCCDFRNFSTVASALGLETVMNFVSMG